ncbi:alpha-L RNA-binding motif-containing protein [Hypoxylon trugodes]|uniref:alpha-L RNA-binding motif-containing protein n=1 Tax=Hypoxylon trugodes TaxID=326681 RepID=UPI00219F70A5|nr:alpha-L RNA-binding motif-containing protein [Hypoxylon trugodes]KAI1384997.1 alpha-L RNA-binding motif-containing protein [Hypoxylon trugodes]
MKPRRFHGLRRPKLRQSWNKYNLYNIARLRDPRVDVAPITFFQQKWRAKGLLRGYHGEHVVERKWVRMFSRRLLGVTDMDTKYMAKYDGSELASGRGSGKDTKPNWDNRRVKERTLTPYMQMTFAPMERRLDIAVFRAMFASSTRQARQFCVHGAVKVNGKVMPYPAYRLNPGDMFSVEPERVLHATGAPKIDPNKIKPNKKRAKAKAEGKEVVEAGATKAAEEEDAEAQPEEAEAAEQDPDTTDAPEPVKQDMTLTKQKIKELIAKAKSTLENEQLSGSQKQEIRKIVKQMKPLLSRAGRDSADPQQITDELTNLFSELQLTRESTTTAERQEMSSEDALSILTDSQLKQISENMAQVLRTEQENPYDPSKPYRTPWQPRPYMGPFAFIPKYLEVNQNICSAVYLRHPVARVGYAEVPTPFASPVSQLAFNWYLRRR